ncbi:MAG: TonB-dependent receptor [Cytophagales bacterium]|nr:TonB-dependent receptor [Cytophagales bacterium]MDW8383885.1 TonB-dependent receptor [Flammeovirgaceae bacterium]
MKKLLLFSFVFVVSTVVEGQEIDSIAQSAKSGESVDVFSMSLEELLNTKITVASKQEETVAEAPSIVSVITSQDIAKYGGIGLKEVVERVCNVYFSSPSYMANNMVSIRGDVVANFNTRVLVLIDGRPFRDNFNMGTNVPIYMSYPLEMIERIEIIRGPGSVLYGSSAFVGVINIITKKGENQTFNSNVRYGSFQGRQISAAGGVKKGDLDVQAGIQYFENKGFGMESSTVSTTRGTTTILPFEGDSLWRDVTLSGTVRASYKNFTLNTFYGKTNQPNLNRNSYDLILDRIFGDLGYSYQLSEKQKVGINVTYNYYGALQLYNYKTNSIWREKHHSNDYIIELSHYWNPSEKFGLVSGAYAQLINGQGQTNENFMVPGSNRVRVWDVRKDTIANPTPYVFVKPYNQIWYAAYSQFNFKFKSFKVVGGLQANKIEKIDLNVVPRISLIYNQGGFTAKLLTSQAFRAGSATERFRDIYAPSIAGNLSLKPEIITTYEASVGYSKERFTFFVTGYYSTVKDIVARSVPADSLLIVNIDGRNESRPIFINADRKTFRGIEMEGKVQVHKRVEFQFSYAFNRSMLKTKSSATRRDTTVVGADGLPEHLAKMGISYNSPFGLIVGIFNNFYAGHTQLFNVGYRGPLFERPKNTHFATLNVAYDFNKLLKMESIKAALLNIYVYNLFDSKFYAPEYSFRRVERILNRSGRAIFVGLNVRF